MVRAIVFDFDGVIVDTEPLHYRAFMEALRPLGITFDYEQYLERYMGYDDRGCLRAVFRDLGRPLEGERERELIEAKSAAFESVASSGVEAFAGAVELVVEAAGRMPVALCSGALRSDIDLILPVLGESGLGGVFRAIVTADDVEVSKPDPASYRLAVERLGVEAGQALAIEDTPGGLASARDAGLRTLGVGTTYAGADLEGAERMVETLESLTVEQLQQWFA